MLFLGIFVILYTFFINYIASDSSYILRHLQLHIIILILIIAPLVKKYSLKEIKFLIYFFLISNLFSLILTFLGLLKDNHAARAFSKSGVEAVEISSNGIGGYGLVYMNVLLIPILFLIIKTINSKKIKIFSVLNLLLIILVLLKANYLIAILLAFFQFSYLIRYYASKKYLSFFLTTLLGFSFYVVYYFKNFFLVAKELLEGGSLFMKLIDIVSLVDGTRSEYGTTDSRSERYIRTIKMIFQRPIFGHFSYDDIGKHSQILDLIAQYGFFIGFLIIILLYNIPKKVLSLVQTKHKKIVKLFIVSSFTLGLLNNFPMQISTLFILLLLVIFFNIKKTQIN